MIRDIYDKLLYRLKFLKSPRYNFKSCTKQEIQRVKQLRDEVRKLEIKDTKATSTWNKHILDLKKHILNDDVRQFLTWEEIKYTMFLSGSDYVFKEYQLLKKSQYNAELSSYLKESKIGSPERFYFLYNSSGNLIHHTYHTLVYHQNFQDKLYNKDLIFEFGGGYGSMCRLIYQMGFNRRYIIYDLPIFSSLQKYYLSSLGYKILTPNNFDKEKNGVLCISTIEELNTISNSIQHINSAFLATWSLSESPLAVREKLREIITQFSSYLIGYQNTFEGIDNDNYFKLLSENIDGVHWEKISIEHLPNNYYLIGNLI